jgi:hypothetical protein
VGYGDRVQIFTLSAETTEFAGEMSRLFFGFLQKANDARGECREGYALSPLSELIYAPGQLVEACAPTPRSLFCRLLENLRD